MSTSNIPQPLNIARFVSLPLLAFFLTVNASVHADDWPCWRGAEGDGTSAEKQWNPAALKTENRILWSVDVGKGYSSIAVAGSRVYTQGIKDNKCVVQCLDTKDGTIVWTYAYDPGNKSHEGPRSTPTVEKNRVYVSGREGEVFCLDAANGNVVWERQLIQEEGIANITWGLSSSPLVIKGVLYLNAGKHGIALDCKSGKTLWCSPAGDKAGYATPVPFSFSGQAALAIFGAKALFAVRASDGKVLWSQPWETKHDVNAADPIIVKNQVFISSGYNRGAALLDISKPTPSIVWENTETCDHFGTPVLLNGYLYGCSGNAGGGKLQCMELATGKIIWSIESGFCSVIMANNQLIVLNEAGNLTIAPASPEGFTPISEARVLTEKVCWTSPAFSDGRIYCRNYPGMLVCVDVRK